MSRTTVLHHLHLHHSPGSGRGCSIVHALCQLQSYKRKGMSTSANNLEIVSSSLVLVRSALLVRTQCGGSPHYCHLITRLRFHKARQWASRQAFFLRSPLSLPISLFCSQASCSSQYLLSCLYLVNSEHKLWSSRDLHTF